MNESKCGLVQMQKKLLMIVVFLFTILTMSILLSSTKVSALKYDVNSIPFYAPDSLGSYGLELTFSKDIDINKVYSQYVSFWKYEDGKCVPYNDLPRYSFYYKFPFISEGSDSLGEYYSLSYAFPGVGSFPSSWASDDLKCMTIESLSNYDGNDFYNRLPVDLIGIFQKILPYRQQSSGIFLKDSYKSEENGLDYSTKFDLGDIFKDAGYPSKISRLAFSLGSPNYDNIDSSEILSGSPIDISGEIVVDWDSPTQVHGFSSSSTIYLQTSYFEQNNGNVYTQGDQCTYDISDLYVDDSGVPETLLKYSCSTILSDYATSDRIIEFALVFNFDYINSNTKFYQFIFDSQVVITDNDDTPGGDWGNAPVGSDTDSAPGSATQFIWNDITSDGVNWTSSLTSLFNFNFVNPFAPIFELFTDSNSCAQIPIIAGMIHSNETQVCPWFDAQTRNIATPVLGIFSMMLVFGFAVSWLGARSGNFVEDNTDGHDWGNIHIGRRK